MTEKRKRELKLLERDGCPATQPLKLSYFQGLCREALSPKTIGQVLLKASEERPDHIGYRTADFDENMSYGELQERADKVSKALLSFGVKKGDLVFLTGVADIEYYVLFFAITQIGLVFHFPEILLPFEKDFREKIKVDPVTIFVGSLAPPEVGRLTAEYARSGKNAVKAVVEVKNACLQYQDVVIYEEFIDLSRNVTDDALQTAKGQVSNQDVAVIFNTSGTTGEPKRICMTHLTLVNFAKFTHLRGCPFKQKENLGILGPVADDVSGLLQNIRPIYNYDDDICLIMAPSSVNTDNKSAKEFMEFVEKERITWYLGMPFELINTVNSPDFNKYDLSTLRGGILVGHLISSALKTRMLEVFTDMQTAYGSTEAVAGAATSPVWSTKEQQISSAGFPFPHAEVWEIQKVLKCIMKYAQTLQVKIVDNNGVIVPIGSEGEIYLKGWHTFWGYWRDPETTRQVKDPDGWVKIGDIGKMDETGHITYVGRAAECVKFKHMGVGVYPSQILNVAKAHPEVAEAKVIGIPTDSIGDMICLCVQLTPSSTFTEDQLKNYMDEQLLDVYRTDHCFIFHELPRTGLRNKVSMSQLREFVIQRLDLTAEDNQ